MMDKTHASVLRVCPNTAPTRLCQKVSGYFTWTSRDADQNCTNTTFTTVNVSRTDSQRRSKNFRIWINFLRLWNLPDQTSWHSFPFHLLRIYARGLILLFSTELKRNSDYDLLDEEGVGSNMPHDVFKMITHPDAYQLKPWSGLEYSW